MAKDVPGIVDFLSCKPIQFRQKRHLTKKRLPPITDVDPAVVLADFVANRLRAKVLRGGSWSDVVFRWATDLPLEVVPRCIQEVELPTIASNGLARVESTEPSNNNM